MQEIEVKILEVNRQKIEEKLVELRAAKIFDDHILTLFLDSPQKDIGTKKDVLRLRKEQKNVELTYKKVHVNKTVKAAQEYSVQVSDLDTTLKIFQALGFSVKNRMEKHRISYRLDSVRFDFDRYIGQYELIPEFLEIEGSVDAIKKYAMMLGFTAKDCLPWDTEDLIKYYAKKVE